MEKAGLTRTFPSPEVPAIPDEIDYAKRQPPMITKAYIEQKQGRVLSTAAQKFSSTYRGQDERKAWSCYLFFPEAGVSEIQLESDLCQVALLDCNVTLRIAPQAASNNFISITNYQTYWNRAIVSYSHQALQWTVQFWRSPVRHQSCQKHIPGFPRLKKAWELHFLGLQ